MLDSDEEITRKVRKAVTDTDGEMRYDRAAKPGLANLLDLLAAATDRSPNEVAAGYERYGDLKNDVAAALCDLLRPVRMPGFLRYVALVIGVFFLFVWAYGGYYSSDIAVGPGKRWLFFLGLGVCLLYLPLHAYRRFVEDRRPAQGELRGPVSAEVAPSERDS